MWVNFPKRICVGEKDFVCLSETHFENAQQLRWFIFDQRSDFES